MAKLILGRDFLPSYGQLPKDTQKKVAKLVETFEHHTGAGINLEKPNAIADPRARTVRVDQFWRGVVAALGGQEDEYVLVDVMAHDDAYAWCERNVFEVNPATGALEIQDIRALKDFGAGRAEPEPAQQPLLANIPDKSFTQLGISEQVIPLIRTVDGEVELEALAALLPERQADALLGLAAGLAPETIYAELVADDPPEAVDTEDLAAAAGRAASGGMFYVVQDAADLQELLNKPFDLWRLFLHPSQRRLAYKPVFNGPVKVTGGAGTGKTVVAMHRAKFLAEHAAPDERVLLTTFTKNLSASLEAAFKELAPDIAERVEVTNVDSLAHHIVREAEGRLPRVEPRVDAHWKAAANDAGVLDLPPEFLAAEYEHVILGQDLRDRQDYFKAQRAGQGVPLDRRARARVWAAVEAFGERLRRGGTRTFLQMARDAADHLVSQGPMFRHVVIDEAQDLHSQQWRMLRALAPEAPNDLFLVGDSHQRIYDRHVSLRSLGIHVVGRSHRLRLNYRTTDEILRWSLALLKGQSFDDLDAGADVLVGYRSTFHGPPPETAGFQHRQEECAALAREVKKWLADGLLPENVGVAARTNRIADEVAKHLGAQGVEITELGRETEGAGVRVGTMHRMKGLEFRAVAVVGAEEGTIPLPLAVCDATRDPAQHDRDMRRERSLLYVACTRARDLLRVSWTGKPSPFIPHQPQGRSAASRATASWRLSG